MYIVYDDFYLKHDTGYSHPENPGRLVAIKKAIDDYHSKEKLILTTPITASFQQVSMVHSKKYIEKIKYYSENSAPCYLDPDTVVSKDTYSCAMLAAGGCIRGIDLILEKHNEDRQSIFFALVRPPGHHAFRAKGTGFCIFNNIAISAMHSISHHGIRKTAIIDFDVHHGNGTQNFFYGNREVFYISLHQYPHYPGTGYFDEDGEGEGKGFNLNIPLVPHSRHEDYIQAFLELIIPLLADYKPQMILVSAGFDGHFQDPLSYMDLTDESYYKIMHLILYIARIASESNADSCCNVGILLEGGYNYEALAAGVLRVIDACLERDLSRMPDEQDELIDFIYPDGQLESKVRTENMQNFNRIKKRFNV